jgi:hypothetical protein
MVGGERRDISIRRNSQINRAWIVIWPEGPEGKELKLNMRGTAWVLSETYRRSMNRSQK